MSNTNQNTQTNENISNAVPPVPGQDQQVKKSNTKWWVLGGVVAAAAIAGAAYMLLTGETDGIEDITIGE